MIKAVLFDVDGVLLDSVEANYQFYHNLFIKAGYTPPTMEDYLPYMHLTLDGIIRNTLQHLTNEEVQKVFKIGKESLDEIYPYDLLIPAKHLSATIQKLHKTYKLGIVTSRLKDHIYAIPFLAKLEKYFSVTVGFEDTDHHKPHPEPLLFASKKLKIKSEEIVYIGDAQSDVTAGKKAGMKVILVAKDNFADADAFTSSFEELPEVVFSLR